MKKLALAFSVVVIAMLTASAHAEHWQHVTTSEAIVVEIDVDFTTKNSDRAKVSVSADGANYRMIFDCKDRWAIDAIEAHWHQVPRDGPSMIALGSTSADEFVQWRRA